MRARCKTWGLAMLPPTATTAAQPECTRNPNAVAGIGRSLVAGLRKAAEEAFLLPLRPMLLVGDGDRQLAHNLFVGCRGLQIHRLLQVVGRRMVAVLQPV